MSDSISINIKFDEKAFLSEEQKHVKKEVKKSGNNTIQDSGRMSLRQLMREI